MSNPAKDARRQCMPLAAWPPADQAAWTQALRSGDPFEGCGLAAHWREGTRRKVLSAYGRWLTFLLHQGALDPSSTPQARFRVDLLRDYGNELRQQVSSVTLAGRITDLREALRVMAPEHEFPHLCRAQSILTARARPSRDKRRKYIHPSVVLDRTLEVFDRIELTSYKRRAQQAVAFRDALLLAVLCTRAPRRGNLSAMTLNRHIVKVGDCYAVQFDGSETLKRPIEQPFPLVLTKYIDRYIDYYRPMLLAGRSSNRLWVSNQGTDLSGDVIYQRGAS